MTKNGMSCKYSLYTKPPEYTSLQYY